MCSHFNEDANVVLPPSAECGANCHAWRFRRHTCTVSSHGPTAGSLERVRKQQKHLGKGEGGIALALSGGKLER